MRIITTTLLLLYDILVEIALILLSPLLVPILARFSYLRAMFPSKYQQSDLLIHCASVGEINALKPLINKLVQEHPQLKIHITCTTINALKIALGFEKRISASLSVLDSLSLRFRELGSIKPKLLCVMETEIWINQLFVAKLMSIPVVFLNARMSRSTLRYYQLLVPFLSITKPTIKAVLCQSEADVLRFKRIIGGQSRLAGNLKYALDLPTYSQSYLREKYKLHQKDILIVWGSSRAGEEKLILDVFTRLKRDYDNLKLVIAVRHPQRLKELQSLLEQYKYSLESTAEEHRDIHVIDTFGVLTEAYAASQIAIVGGSFFDFGGHNPLEPAFYGNSVVMGPYHSSCRDSVEKLQAAGAILLSDATSLADDLESLIKDRAKRITMGEAAKKVLDYYKDSLQNHIMEIEKWID